MRYFLFIFFFLLSTVGQTFSLKADSPKKYVVQRGDTLWLIANRYLKNPWEWKQLWRANPHIKNPNRLYPGAVIILSYHHKRPYLKVVSNGTVKLSPAVRPTRLDEAIPLIPLGDIKPYLNESLVLDEDVLRRAPYVVALMGEHMLGGQGNEVYVKGLRSAPSPEGETTAYSLFRPGRNYIDPVTKTLLGYQAKLVGYGELVSGGEIATVLLTSINEGINIQDKVLINNSPEFSLYFEPSAPATTVNGVIMDMPDGMPTGNTQGAVGSVVVINVGSEVGLQAGDVLGIYAKTKIIADPKNHLISIKLPPERIGEALLFRTFTKTSFALIVRSTRAVYLMDTVTNP
jgi:hypothetical protein